MSGFESWPLLHCSAVSHFRHREGEDEEMRLAESMSMAVFLNLNNSQDSRQDPKRRRSNLKDINQLETVEEASRGEKSL